MIVKAAARFRQITGQAVAGESGGIDCVEALLGINRRYRAQYGSLSAILGAIRLG